MKKASEILKERLKKIIDLEKQLDKSQADISFDNSYYAGWKDAIETIKTWEIVEQPYKTKDNE